VRAPSRATWTLIAAVLGSSMSFIDGTAVNVALPVLQKDLGADNASVQWVVEGYSLFLSALILIGGSLGDVFGRRAMFGAGIALFALASIVCGFAPSIGVLVFGRCLQGIGGALATPGSLALISSTYAGVERGKAIGTWSGASALTGALGPVLGGALVQFGSWRMVFFVNVPIALAVLAILRTRVDETRDPAAWRRPDFLGAVLATLGLGGLVYGLISLQGAAASFVPFAVTSIALGIAVLVAFVVVQAREAHPMMRLELFASRAFSAANAYTFVLYAALGGSLYFVPFDLIDVQRYPPALAGAALLPMIVILATTSRFSGGLVAKLGARVPLALGAALAACGFATFAFVGVGRPYWVTFFPGSIVLGCGITLMVAPLTTIVMDAVDTAHAGIASGINNAVSRTSGLVAIAALGVVISSTFSASVARDAACAPLSRAARAAMLADSPTLLAGKFPPDVRGPRETAAAAAVVRSAYADGFRMTMLVSALLALVAAAIAFDRSFRRASPSR
jgi:EmrB/QacA subfamily drug resistance transporter